MKCDKIREQLVFYDEGLLSEKERLSVDAHLKECSGCAQELNVLRGTLKAYVEHEESSVTPEPSPFLFSRISSEVERSGKRKGVFVLRFAFGMSFAFLFAAIASRFMTPEREERESQLPERSIHQAHKIERIKNKLATHEKEQIKVAKIQIATPVKHPVIAKASKKTYKTSRIKKKHRIVRRIKPRKEKSLTDAPNGEKVEQTAFDSAEEDGMTESESFEISAQPQPFITPPQGNTPYGGALPLLLNIEEIQRRQEEQQNQEEMHAAMLHIQMVLGMNPANSQPKSMSIMP